jgi:cellulose synthase/poly-beta-1,6-N-acetylglucosamine synthase-like glycosyltransferase
MYLSVFILCYFGLSSFYMLLFAFSGKLKRINKDFISKSFLEKSVAIMIPAYKEDLVIIDTVLKTKKIEYSNYEIVVIADSLKPETLIRLRELNITVIEVSFNESTKVKALNQALGKITDFDTALILDADNHLKADFLKLMNKNYQEGNYKVYQGQRVAKNWNTPIALLDALSEAINNNIYSQGPINVNLSARLVGSGMLFDFKLLKQLLSECTAIGGFDKELELKLLERREFLQYLPECIVYDEKVSTDSNFQKQRTRWIAAQFQFFRAYWLKAFKQLIVNGNIDFFNKIIQLALPPRLLIPVILLLGSIIHWFIYPQLFVIWLICLAANILANLISIPYSMYNKDLLLATIKLPGLIVITLIGLLNMGDANKRFLHTTHGKDSDS